MSDEITAGEVSRALDRLRADVHDDIDGLRAEMRIGFAALNFVPRDEIVAQQRATDARIKTLEDWQTWATRIVLGAVMLAVLGLVLVGGSVR